MLLLRVRVENRVVIWVDIILRLHYHNIIEQSCMYIQTIFVNVKYEIRLTVKTYIQSALSL